MTITRVSVILLLVSGACGARRGTPRALAPSADPPAAPAADAALARMLDAAARAMDGGVPSVESPADAKAAGPADAKPAALADTAAPAAPAAGACPNGVRQLYASAAGKAAPWALGFGDWQSRVRQFGTVTGAGAATEVLGSGQVRMTVMAERSDCEGDQDQGRALARGYMCSPRDWTNYEMTGYVQLVEAGAASGDQDFTWYGGGGRHTGDGPPIGCLGSAYKASYHYKNRQVRFGKESWHVNYDYKRWKDVAGGIDYSADKGRWLGMKLVRYEIVRNGKKGVRSELWLDLGGIRPDGAPMNDWKLADVAEDHPDAPSWGEQAKMCGAPVDNQIMFWGGPWITFRWDDTTAKLRLACVQEIAPPATAPAAP